MAIGPARTVSVGIRATPRAVYEYVADPRHLPDWAPGLARSVRAEDGGWTVETASGPVRLVFAGDNPFGVLDHRVTGGGLDLVVPMRVIPNGDGAEVLFTVVAGAGADEDEVERDLALVRSDLDTLKRLLEDGPAGGGAAGQPVT